MFAIETPARAACLQYCQTLHDKGVLATDMETSALIAAAGDLGVASATLCLGTVDGISQEKLGLTLWPRAKPECSKSPLMQSLTKDEYHERYANPLSFRSD